MSLASWMTALQGPEKTEQWFAVAGARMRCLVRGSGPSLLLLHGLLGVADAWREVASRLSDGSTVYAPDALGIGGSDRVAGLDPGLEATAARTIAMMDAAGIETTDVMGTSHGGAVAMMMAARYPGRIRSLILHAPANPFSDIADPLIHFYQKDLGRWFASRIGTLPTSLQALALGRMYGDAHRVRDGSLEPYMASLRVPGTVEHVLGILDRWDVDMEGLRAALPIIRSLPTVLIWGGRDRAVSLASGERLVKCFDRASLVVIPDAGHLAHDEVPAALAGVVQGFLGGLKRQPHRSARPAREEVQAGRDAA